ncbi:MAG: cation diffusion facilitator family transporter [Gammaproteobacteria bacterium]|nr:cation diffusion facilitator family transporter [Gammaproteobacteria bacterium]
MSESSAPLTQAPNDHQSRYRETRRVTLIGAALDLLLGLAKIIGGYIAQSQALIADGVHSLSDLSTDILVLFAAKHANVEADEDHPYGHARIETAATVGLGILLLLIAVGIGIDAVIKLISPEPMTIPAAWALAIAAVSVASKEWIYRYTMRSAERLNSNLLRANAWHSRSDALSSIVVIIGVGGAQLGFGYLDAIAALIVAAMIVKIGVDLSWSSLRELVDTGLEPGELKDIRATILSVGGVKDLHELRTRRMGGKALVDVHIILGDPTLSVSEGHHISENVRSRLIRKIEDVEDVMVHIDPEDDETAAPSEHLDLRTELLPRLRRRWRHLEAANEIRRVTLHYLNGKVHVELELPLSLAPDAASAERLAESFRKAVGEEPDVAAVRLVFGLSHQHGASADNARKDGA